MHIKHEDENSHDSLVYTLVNWFLKHKIHTIEPQGNQPAKLDSHWLLTGS